MATIRAHLAPTEEDTLTVAGSTNLGQGYTYSQPLPTLEDIPVFHVHYPRETPSFHSLAPAPYPWAPKFLPDHWVYTYGFDITGHPRLGAEVVHIPTITTIYIDAAGT